MQRAFTNILATHVDTTAMFYQSLLGMTRHFDSDWFVILTHPGVADLELGILSRNSDIVPTAARGAPQGIMLTFVVDDVDSVFAEAQQLAAPVVEPPTDMPYGQRRMLIRDPEGTLVDVSAPVAPVRM